MAFFYDFSQNFLGVLSYLGDFLLISPFSDVQFQWNVYSTVQPPVWLLKFFYEVLPNMTIAEMIFGSFLTFILAWKLITFFTDIIA